MGWDGGEQGWKEGVQWWTRREAAEAEVRGDHLEDEAGAAGMHPVGPHADHRDMGACVRTRLLFTQITAQALVWTRFIIPTAAMSATFLAQKMSFSHCTSPEILCIVLRPP